MAWTHVHIDFTTLFLINMSRIFSIHLGNFGKLALIATTESGSEEAYSTCDDHQKNSKKDFYTNLRSISVIQFRRLEVFQLYSFDIVL